MFLFVLIWILVDIGYKPEEPTESPVLDGCIPTNNRMVIGSLSLSCSPILKATKGNLDMGVRLQATGWQSLQH